MSVAARLASALADPTAPMAAISALLDDASPADRRAALFSLNGKQQSALYDRAAQSPTLTLADLVPPSLSPKQEVVHFGQNTLPVFRAFEKRMCRAASGDAIYGYNEGFTRRFIGPGYFVAVATGTANDGAPTWRERGGVVVDYFRVPDGNGVVVDGWPAVVPNERGLQRFVFRGMRDYLRKVSTHASIGAAYQGEKSFNSWFVLVRD
jgi:hypothetical protein